MRCRKASPRSPPEAKLSKSWSRERCLGELDSTGMRKSTKNGAAEISTVAPSAWGRESEGNHGASQPSRASPSSPHPLGTHVGPEGDSVQVVLGAWSRSLPRGYVAMFVAMSSVVVAIVGVAMAVAMVQIPM